MMDQAAAGSNVPAASSLRPRLLLMAAIVLAACWWVLLALLSFFTANPVTLNREQILRASFVVTGSLSDDPAANQILVEREWKQNALHGTILVNNLAAVPKPRGKIYIIPLTRVGHGFEVTETVDPKLPPLIYPATPEALSQLRTILNLPQDR
jgi:hypothetical protein